MDHLYSIHSKFLEWIFDSVQFVTAVPGVLYYNLLEKGLYPKISDISKPSQQMKIQSDWSKGENGEGL